MFVCSKVMKALVSLTFMVALDLLLADAYITKSVYKKIECETDPTVAVKPVCVLKPIKRDVKNVTLGFTLLKPAAKIFLHFKNFRKTYTNHFMPGFLDSTHNYCQIANQSSPTAAFVISLMKRLSFYVYRFYMENVHGCPIKAGPLLGNATLVSNITNQPFIPPGEYKITYHFFNENNKTLYKVTLYTVYQDKNPRSYRN